MSFKQLWLAAFIVLLAAFFKPASAQTSFQADTLKLTLPQAEQQFVAGNLQVLAQRYNIDIAQAQVITARLFNNPNFQFSNGLYATGVNNAVSEQAVGVSQLITTAGKRNKNIQLAKLSVQQSQYQFFDLLRTLRYSLRSDFFDIYYQQQSSKVYTQAIQSLNSTLGAFRQQYAKGNIAEKELLRIQSELYSLQNEYNNLQTGIDTLQREFKLLVRVPAAAYVLPQYTGQPINTPAPTNIPYQLLLDSALVNRYDLKAARNQVNYQTTNLSLQRANAVPDVSLNVNYDRLGAYGNNFLGAGFSMDLPFFNRNQGNIKAARLSIEQSKLQLQSVEAVVENDVITNYKIALRQQQLRSNIDPAFRQNFTHLIGEVFKNYQLRNISLLEFLDFYESYKDNIVQSNTLEYNYLNSLEQINFVTGTHFFNQ
ncbi:TolC family protein [Mucilaginibacter sp. CSA2-8R]|uniref:TolC family protein n=1 Tax=Mucilaginibacter sp. CSA2-8R TaxID=3141542 RepID=UPI00315DF11C